MQRSYVVPRTGMTSAAILSLTVGTLGALGSSGCRGPVGSGRLNAQLRVAPAIKATSAPSQQPARPAAARGPLAITDVTVIDVRDGRLLPEQTVVVVGSRVRAVGPAKKVRLPRGAHVVDGRGKYLVPGFWDMHAHVWDPRAFGPMLAAGMTGYLDMWAPHRIDTVRQWQREIAAGTRLGPRWVTPGPPLQDIKMVERQRASGDTGIAGMPRGANIFMAATTPEEARRVVDSLKRLRVDFIKNHDEEMSRPTYFALMAEARRLKIPVTGHLPKSITPMEASDSGQRSIAHVYAYNGPCQPSDSAPGKEERCAALVAKFIRNGTWIVTTTCNVPDQGIPTVQNIVRASRRLGVPVPLLAGTDLLLYTPFGPPEQRRRAYEDQYKRFIFGIHDELEMLVKGELTLLEALQSATLNPAIYLNATDSLGTVAAGKLADLVLLDANPLDEIRNTRAIRAVVANGRYFDRAALDSLMVPPDTTDPSEPHSP